MAIRTDTTTEDLNDDGLPDQTTIVVSEMVDTLVLSKTTYDSGTLFPHNYINQVLYGYDELLRCNTEIMKTDWEGDGVFDTTSTLSRAFNAEGRVGQEQLASADFDGDGAPDYLNTATFTYNAAGLMTEDLRTFSSYGVTGPADYVRNTWTYRPDGQVATHSVDDFFSYDCEITEFYTYRGDGKLTKITEQNEIRFGDGRARVTDTFSYNRDGSMKEHTTWGEMTEWGWSKWTQDQFLIDTPGYDKTQKLVDLTGDYKFEFKEVTETWFNAEGHDTHILTSTFNGTNGLLGRDLTVKTWVGNDMVAMTVDDGIDGVIDLSFTSVVSDVLLA